MNRADNTPRQKPLLDKLGIKPGMRVLVLGVDDPPFRRDLRSRRVEMAGEAAGECDMIFFGAEDADDMARLRELRGRIRKDGAVWVIYRKGQHLFNENNVLRLGLESGMVDVKVVRFSDTHTGTKFVIRKADR